MYNNIKFFCFFLFLVFSYNKTFAEVNYETYIDSADGYFYSDPELSLKILHSVPEPLNKNLKGRLSEYYQLIAMVYYVKDNIPKTHKYFLLAIEAAEMEGDFDRGGAVCLELFNIELQGKVDDLEWILEKARYFFKKTNNEDGLLEVKQQYAYIAFSKNDFKKSIRLNQAIIENCKKAENQYINLIGSYMLSSSYFNILDLENGQKYFKELTKLRGKNGVNDNTYYYYVASLNYDLAIYYYKKKESQKAIYYFNKVQNYFSYVGIVFKKQYYSLGVDIFKQAKKPEISVLYKDSLLELHKKENSLSTDESFSSNKTVLSVNNNLKQVKTIKNLYFINILILILVIVFLLFIFRKKLKKGSHALKQKMDELIRLKNEQKKLALKIGNLEDYISELSASLSALSKTDSVDLQREKLSELRKEMNIVSNSFLSEDNIKRMSVINEEFFESIQKTFPDLNESEILICYYLYLGMKNKEIATYMKSTLRGIESKRYRISKKMNIAAKDISVAEYIKKILTQK